MFKKTIEYTDFNGNKKTGVFRFNLTRPELMEMKQSPLYEMQEILDRIDEKENPDEELTYAEKDEIKEKLGAILRDLVIQSYGVVSPDGERFNKRIGDRRFGAGEDFVETMAYESLYMEMMDISKLVKFVTSVIPEDVSAGLDATPEYKKLMTEIEQENTTSN